MTFQHFDDLYKHPHCTEFISELLDFIEGDLLRMREVKRAKMNEIVAKVEAIYQKCKDDDRYCNTRVKAISARVRTDLSELEAVVSYSPQMQERLKNEVKPQRKIDDPRAYPSDQPRHHLVGIGRRGSPSKAPKRMPSVQEGQKAVRAARNLVHEPERPCSEVIVDGITEDEDQRAESSPFTEPQFQNGSPKVNREVDGSRDAEPVAQDDQGPTFSATSHLRQAGIAGSVDPTELVSEAQEAGHNPRVPTGEQLVQGVSRTRDDRGSERDVDSSVVQTSLINHPPLSKVNATRPRARSAPSGAAKNGDPEPKPQGAGRCRLEETNPRRYSEQGHYAPLLATRLASSGGYALRTGSGSPFEKPASSHSPSDPPNPAQRGGSTRKQRGWRGILRSIICWR